MSIQYKIILIILIVILSLSTLFAQAPDTMWTRTYGGDFHDRGVYIQQTLDNGFIITGNTESFGAGSSDLYLIKVDEFGDSVWTRTYGGEGWETGTWVEQTYDGGYIVVGQTTSFGSVEGDVYLIKTDTNGDTLWTKTYGGEELEGGVSAQQTDDGGLIIIGFTASYGAGSFDIYLIKTDIVGNTIWTKTYGGPSYDLGSSVAITADGGYILSGYSHSEDPPHNFCFLVRTDEEGDTLWTKSYEGFVGLMSTEIIHTIDDCYMILGAAEPVNEEDDIDYYLIKTDLMGDTIWTKKSGYQGDDFGFSLQQTSDNGFIICGKIDTSFSDDMFIAKTDAYGDSMWSMTINGYHIWDDAAYCIRQTTDNCYVMTGAISAYNSNRQVYLCKLAPDQTSINYNYFSPDKYNLVQNYPNPFNASTTISFSLSEPQFITLKIYDLLGREVQTLVDEQKQAGTHQAIWNAENAVSGMYFYKISAGDYTETRKMVLLK